MKVGDDAVSSDVFPLLDVAIESDVLLLEWATDDEDDDEIYPEKLATSVFDVEASSIDVFSSSFTLDAINFSRVPHMEGDQQEMFRRSSAYSHVIVVFIW